MGIISQGLKCISWELFSWEMSHKNLFYGNCLLRICFMESVSKDFKWIVFMGIISKGLSISWELFSWTLPPKDLFHGNCLLRIYLMVIVSKGDYQHELSTLLSQKRRKKNSPLKFLLWQEEEIKTMLFLTSEQIPHHQFSICFYFSIKTCVVPSQ